MNNKIIEFLQKEKYTPYIEGYSEIDFWIDLWKGKTKFHEYYEVYGTHREKKLMYSLGMAQRLAQDWASICWTEKDQIKTSTANQKYLQERIKEIKLNTLLPLAIEKASYSGTCGAILKIKNAKLVENQDETYLKTDKFTQYDLILMTADQIVPLRVEHGKIIDCAFISESIIEDKTVYYIEIHELVKRRDENGEIYESYKIRNVYIDKEGKEVEKENVIKQYYTNSDIPLFSILTPPVDNCIDTKNGLGVAVYAGAIDQLYGVDIAYHNFVMDYYLGGKKMFYNKKLCQRDEEGNVIYPTDIQKQQWQIVGDEMENANENSLIHEYNPDLRTQENKEGIQFALDLLSFKCGLGTKYYQFDSGSVVTATQYLGERQDMTINAKKFRENVDEFIENICKGIIILGKILFKEQLNENAEIMVENEDGFLVSTEDLKQQYITEISAGLRAPEEYRMKFFNEDEETARKWIERAGGTEVTIEDMGA